MDKQPSVMGNVIVFFFTMICTFAIALTLNVYLIIGFGIMLVILSVIGYWVGVVFGLIFGFALYIINQWSNFMDLFKITLWNIKGVN